jgi:hypothetical protein
MSESLDPHVGNHDSMSAPETHAGDDSESMSATRSQVGQDSPSAGDSLPGSASDASHAAHDASQLGHEMNSADSDLDAEPHVGHNAPVNRKPDNDPESSGN